MTDDALWRADHEHHSGRRRSHWCRVIATLSALANGCATSPATSARADFDRALAEGRALLESRRWTDAIERLKPFTEMPGSWPDERVSAAYRMIGQAEEARGRPGRALAAFDSALAYARSDGRAIASAERSALTPGEHYVEHVGVYRHDLAPDYRISVRVRDVFECRAGHLCEVTVATWRFGEGFQDRNARLHAREMPIPPPPPALRLRRHHHVESLL